MSRDQTHQNDTGALKRLRSIACQSGLALFVIACSQGPALQAPLETSAGKRSVVHPEAAVARNLKPRARQDAGELGLRILRPSTPATDEVVAKIGEQVVRKSHVYDRWRETFAQDTREMVDLLVLDLVVAAHAQRLGISVEQKWIDSLVDSELESMGSEVERSFRGRRTLEEYLLRVKGMPLAEYRKGLRLNLARERYRSYVIRYLAMLEDQIEVRFIATKDRDVLVEVARKVKAGADFATLAGRYSEDEDTRDDGGRLAPFGRDHSHPIVAEAFALEPGDMSEIFSHEGDGVLRHFLVYCLRKMPKRDQGFAELREEIDRELEHRPIERLEHTAFFLRWCQATESLPSGPEAR